MVKRAAKAALISMTLYSSLIPPFQSPVITAVSSLSIGSLYDIEMHAQSGTGCLHKPLP